MKLVELADNAYMRFFTPLVTTAIFKRWWFWVVLIFLVLVAVYLQGYMEWRGEQATYEARNAAHAAYWKTMLNQQAKLEEQYKNDPYGGATPEETLRLFIEALEKKDYVLAANYYIPEKKIDAKKSLERAVGVGTIETYISILKGNKKGVPFENQQEYEIYFYDKKGAQIHLERFHVNPFTTKWLISEL